MTTATAPTVPTREEFDTAARDFARSKLIEKQAESLKTNARKVILAYVEAHPDEFKVAADSETGKTIEPIAPVADLKQCRITNPTTQPKPARFDDARTEEAWELFMDIEPTLAEKLFETITTHRFRGPEQVIETATEFPEFAALVARTLIGFTLAAEEAQALAPRLDIK